MGDRQVTSKGVSFGSDRLAPSHNVTRYMVGESTLTGQEEEQSVVRGRSVRHASAIKVDHLRGEGVWDIYLTKSDHSTPPHSPSTTTTFCPALLTSFPRFGSQHVASSGSIDHPRGDHRPRATIASPKEARLVRDYDVNGRN